MISSEFCWFHLLLQLLLERYFAAASPTWQEWAADAEAAPCVGARLACSQALSQHLGIS
jgi:hypothetical protein